MKKFLFIALILLLLPAVSAKSYTIEKAVIDMSVDDDGSILVNESISFIFSGSFTFVFRDIDYNKESISDVAVFEYTDSGLVPLKFEFTDIDSDTKRVTWHYSAVDTKKKFLLSYRLSNALKVYDDVADFNWKIWGSGWDHPLGEIEGNFILPKKAASNLDVYTWGHPQLNGKIAIQKNQTVIFQAFNIPSGQWVELHIAFPASMLDGCQKCRRMGGQGLQSIIEIENSYTPPSDGVDFPWEDMKNASPGVLAGALLLLVGPVLFMIALFLIFYFWKGREPEVKGYEQLYERDIPYDYSPAIVSALIRQHDKKPNAQDFVACILHLCLKGILKLNVVKKEKILGIFGKGEDYEIVFQKSEADLPKHERMVVNMLKAYGDKDITFSKLKSSAQDDSWHFRKMFKEWQEQVKQEAIGMGFFAKCNLYVVYSVIAVIFLIIGCIPPFITIGFAFGGGLGLLLNSVFRQALPRRTEKGALHYKKWVTLRHFLKDFRVVKEHPPASMILWEKYIVYGLSLGVADKVEKEMKLLIPNKDSRSGIFIGSVNYHSLAAASFLSSSVSTFSSGFASASGTSGSGGFGSGGGGGGGGGGAG
jgi:uncharacterized membrane protein